MELAGPYRVGGAVPFPPWQANVSPPAGHGGLTPVQVGALLTLWAGIGPWGVETVSQPTCYRPVTENAHISDVFIRLAN